MTLIHQISFVAWQFLTKTSKKQALKWSFFSKSLIFQGISLANENNWFCIILFVR